MASNPRNIGIDDTVLDTWFERDRAYVILYEKDGEGGFGELIAEWWDDDVMEAVEDGFLKPRDYHGSAFEYAEQAGLLDPANRVKKEKVRTGWVIVHSELGALVTWRGGQMVWSSSASEADLKRGATAFGDEESAREWFDDQDEGFQEALDYHEFELDVAFEGNSFPSRVSLAAIEKAGAIPSAAESTLQP